MLLASLALASAVAHATPVPVARPAQPAPPLTAQEAAEVLQLLQTGIFQIKGQNAGEFIRLELHLQAIAKGRP